jgi:hypothetical protein
LTVSNSSSSLQAESLKRRSLRAGSTTGSVSSPAMRFSVLGSAIMRVLSSAKARAMLWGSEMWKPWPAAWRSAKA